MNNTVYLAYEDGQPMNALVDYILINKKDFLGRLLQFSPLKGKSTLFGSGEDIILSITITYASPTKEDLADIEEIIKVAKGFGKLKDTPLIKLLLERVGE